MEAEEGNTNNVKGEEKEDVIPAHPYADLLSNFSPTDFQLEKRDPIKAPELAATPLTIIDTKQDLESMMNKLKQETEIAVAVSFIVNDTFRGLIGLVQFSTRSEDFIVDALALKEELKVFNEVFLDTNIVKVMNQVANANNPYTNKVERMQQEFGVYMVNLVDVGIAERVLNPQSLKVFLRSGLAKILKKHCGVTIADNLGEKIDRRGRPLSDKMLTWCREDTHHLLHLYDVYRNALVTAGTIHKLYEECNVFCSAVWYPGKYALKPDTYKSILLQFRDGKLNEQQTEVFRLIHDWRWKIAERRDEGTQKVLPNVVLAAIAKWVPTTAAEMSQCCTRTIGSVHPTVKKSMKNLLNIVKGVVKKIPCSTFTNINTEMGAVKHKQQGGIQHRLSLNQSRMGGMGPRSQVGHMGGMQPWGGMHPMGGMGPRGPMGQMGAMDGMAPMGGMDPRGPVGPMGCMGPLGTMNPMWAMGWMGSMGKKPYHTGNLCRGMGSCGRGDLQKQGGSARFEPYGLGQSYGRGGGW